MAHFSPQNTSRFFKLVLNKYERASSKNHQWQKFSSFNFKLSCFSMKDEHCAPWEAVDSYFYQYVWGEKKIIFSFVGILTRLFQDRAVTSDTDTIFWLSTDGEHRTMLSHIELYRYMNLDERWNFRETGNLVSRFEWLRWLDVRKSSEWDPPGVFRLILISNWLW